MIEELPMIRQIFASRSNQKRSSLVRASARRQRMSVENLEGRQLLTMDFTAAVGLGGSYLSTRSAAPDGQGNTYVTGAFGGTVNFNPAGSATNLTAAGNQDVFLAKYAPGGGLIWAKDLAGSPGNRGMGSAVAVDPAGNVALGGQFTGSVSFPAGATLSAPGSAVDAFVAKFDPSGNYLWANPFDNGATQAVNGLATDAAGDIYATGNFAGSGNFNQGGGPLVGGYGINGFALKLTPGGSTAWAVAIGGTGSQQGKKIAVDGQGNVDVAGTFNATATVGGFRLATAGGLSSYVTQLSGATGATRWADAVSGPSGVQLLGGLAADTDGGVYIGGTFYDTAAVAGSSLTAGSPSTPEAFVAKLGSGGVVQWATQLDADQGASVNDLKLDGAGGVYAGGNFTGTTSFDPAGRGRLISGQGSDGFVAKLTASAGSYQYAVKGGGSGVTTVTAIAVSAPDVVQATGSYASPGTFGGTTLGGAGLYNSYLGTVSAVAAPVGGRLGFGNTFGLGAFAFDTLATAVDSAGSIYITGGFRLTANFNPNGTGGGSTYTSGSHKDIYLAKYNQDGSIAWVKDFTGSSGKTSKGTALALDSAGNIIMGGQFSGSIDLGGRTITAPGDATDGLITKFDTNGNLLWYKQFDNGATEIVNGLDVDAANNIYATGNFYGNGNFGLPAALPGSGGGINGFALKLDASGNSAWAADLGGYGSVQGKKITFDRATGSVDVAGTFNGGINVGGISLPQPSGSTLSDYVAQFNASTGSAKWVDGLGGASFVQSGGLAVDGSGNVFAGGTFTGTASFGSIYLSVPASSGDSPSGFVTKLASNGGVAWAVQFAADQGASVTDLRTDAAGNVYAGGNYTGNGSFNLAGTGAGGAGTMISANGGDAFVASLDNSGAYRWVMGGSAGRSSLTALAVSGIDAVTLVGAYTPPVNFAGTSLPAIGLSNAFVATIRNTGPAASRPHADFSSAVGLGGRYLSTRSSATDAQGDTYLTGAFGGTVDFNPAGTASRLTAAGTQDTFLAKYAPGGGLLWVKDLAGTPGGRGVGSAVTVDPSGNVVIGGQFTGAVTFTPGYTVSAPGEAVDAFVAKYDANGGYLWAKQYDNGTREAVNDLATDSSGNVFATGNFADGGNFGQGGGALVGGYGTNGFALKLTPGGSTAWAVAIGGTGSQQGKKIAVDGQGNVDVAGTFNATATVGGFRLATAGGLSSYVTQLSGATGATRWADAVSGPSGVQLLGGLAADTDGGVYIGGTFYDTAAVAGSSLTAGSPSTPEAFVAKLGSGGVVQWATQLDADQGASVNDLKLDGAGGVYAGGNFTGTTSFDPAGRGRLISGQGSDGFVAKLTASTGSYQYAVAGGGSGVTTVTAITVIAPDVVQATGSYASPGTFGGTTLGGVGLYSSYIATVSMVQS